MISHLARRRENNMLLSQDRDVLEFLKTYNLSTGRAPTIREIAHSCYISSTSMVTSSLKRLEEERLISRLPGVPRGIKVLNDNP